MKLLASLFFLVALVTSAYSQVSCNKVGGVPVDGPGCSCLSSFIGENCSLSVVGECTLPTVSPLAITRVAELMTPEWTSDKMLQITLTSDAKQNRYFDYISLLPTGWEAGCAYPGSFVKSFDNVNCKDEFTGIFQFPHLLANCGFEQVQGEPGFDTYQGAIYVSAHDSLTPLRNHQIFRTTKASHHIQLSFPNFINFTISNLQVLSAIDVQAAVTFQDYDPETNLFTVRLTSSVQWPYRLKADESFNTAEPFYSVTVEASEGGCNANNDCLQISTITFNPENCQPLAETKTVHWISECRNDCGGLTGAPSVDFTIDIPDLCPRVDITASLSGELNSYSDPDHVNKAQIFVSQQTLYFTITLEASVEVLQAQLLNLTVVVNGNPNSLVADSIPTGLATQAGFLVDQPTEEVIFQFKAIPGIFNGGDVTLFTVEALVEVTYKTTFGTSGRKRDVLQSTVGVGSSLVFDGTKSASQGGLLGLVFG